MKVLILLLCLSVLVVASGQLSTYLAKDELSAIQSRAKKSLLEPSSLINAYHDSRLLEVTKAKTIDCNCGALGKLVKNKNNIPLDIYYGLKAASSCGCEIKPLRSIEDAIEEDITVSIKYYRTQYLLHMTHVTIVISIFWSFSPHISVHSFTKK
jgi:hypothetical protein